MSSFQKFWAFLPRILVHHNHIKTKTQVVHHCLGSFFELIQMLPSQFFLWLFPQPKRTSYVPSGFASAKSPVFSRASG